MHPSAAQILRFLGGRVGEDLTNEPLVSALQAFTSQACATHPTLQVSDEQWAGQLWSALQGHDPRTWIERLSALNGSELMLAAALSAGDPAALELFEQILVPAIDRTLRRFSLSPDAFAELRQRIRIRLLVSEPPDPPRISQYRGTGSLEGWVRTVAARVALNARRDQTPHVQLDEWVDQLSSTTPELARLRHEHRRLFVATIREAFLALDRRNRSLLRLRYLESMTAASLARAYSVHESTMSRWLASARAQLMETFERLAREQTGAREGVGDLVEVMHSRLDQSLSGLFASGVLDPNDGTDREGS